VQHELTWHGRALEMEKMEKMEMVMVASVVVVVMGVSKGVVLASVVLVVVLVDVVVMAGDWRAHVPCACVPAESRRQQLSWGSCLLTCPWGCAGSWRGRGGSGSRGWVSREQWEQVVVGSGFSSTVDLQQPGQGSTTSRSWYVTAHISSRPHPDLPAHTLPWFTHILPLRAYSHAIRSALTYLVLPRHHSSKSRWPILAAKW